MSSDATAQLRPAIAADRIARAALRHALWPEATAEEHFADLAVETTDPDSAVAFVTILDDVVVGFAEATIRNDYVNGCDSSPVAFLEGVYVIPAARHRGLARALCAAVEAWARDRGLGEIASDSELANADAYAFHKATGFEETERVIFYRKRL